MVTACRYACVWALCLSLAAAGARSWSSGAGAAIADDEPPSENARVDYTGYKVFRLVPHTDQQLEHLAELYDKYEVSIARPPHLRPRTPLIPLIERPPCSTTRTPCSSGRSRAA